MLLSLADMHNATDDVKRDVDFKLSMSLDASRPKLPRNSVTTSLHIVWNEKLARENGSKFHLQEQGQLLQHVRQRHDEHVLDDDR